VGIRGQRHGGGQRFSCEAIEFDGSSVTPGRYSELQVSNAQITTSILLQDSANWYQNEQACDAPSASSSTTTIRRLLHLHWHDTNHVRRSRLAYRAWSGSFVPALLSVSAIDHGRLLTSQMRTSEGKVHAQGDGQVSQGVRPGFC
jgi:hypothetical protein